ncbi:MAG TPA: M28 family peptidase [Bacteroidota bacterium]|nr:M28 family peptidase [Bacteroidota bacterium]
MKWPVLFVLPIAFAAAQVAGVDPEARTGFESINASDVKTYLSYLASDALQGRETSYPGERLAAEYIADRFRSFGLRPMGDNGSYLQHYDVDVLRVDDSSAVTVSNGVEQSKFTWGKGLIAFGARDTAITGHVECVGYMDTRTTPEGRAALAGRIVLAFAGTRPGSVSGAAVPRRLFGIARRDSGALATLIVADDTGAASFPQVMSTMYSLGVGRGRMVLKGEPVRPGRFNGVAFFVSPAVGEAILKSSGLTLREVRRMAAQDSAFPPMNLDPVTVSIDEKAIREERHAENVVGMIEGSDPVLKNDVVVFSAHFDHLGVTPGGAIYHGADDNGSGTSMVMELAHAFAVNPTKPRCSLLFLAVSGEEKGLLGSSYYTEHPAIPLSRTVADFNTDMIGRMDSIHQAAGSGPYTYLIGSDKISTELDSIVRAADAESNNVALDYGFDNDRDPNQFYKRSDHYNFARHGVPIAFFFTGVHADYHRPTDTIDKILFDRIVKIGQVVYYAGWKTANAGGLLPKNVSSNEYRDTPSRGGE